MRGAIAGDIVGSPFEGRPLKTIDFPLGPPHAQWMRFTDDTVLTLATAQAILAGSSYGASYKSLGRRYPLAGYGGSFRRWLLSDSVEPYGSWGNGAAMRVSPVGWAFDSEERVLAEARRSASATHDHVDAIAAAQAVALGTFWARQGIPREEIARAIAERFSYELDVSIAELRPEYEFDVSSAGSVPQAIRAFVESADVEHAIRLAVSLGGDSDTQASIAGGLAFAADRHLPAALNALVEEKLPDELLAILEDFERAVPAARMTAYPGGSSATP